MNLRPDLRVIAGLIPANAKVLDVGCGDGALLAALTAEKGVDGRGLEIAQPKVSQCVGAGLSVIQGDADTDLIYYPDRAFDVAILSNTLQATRDPRHVLRELTRIAELAIVAVPNFGYWENRLHLAIKGRMPVTRALAYEWYDTPNIHFCTLNDFVRLCVDMGLAIEKRLWVGRKGTARAFRGADRLANVLGQEGVFVVRATEI